MSKEPTYTSPSKARLADELSRLDKELISLLQKRSALLAEAQPQTAGKRPKDLDSDLEKTIWRVWESAISPAKRDTRLWRTLFTLVQELPPADTGLAEAVESSDKTQGFLLTPRAHMGDVAAQSPGSHDMACFNLALAVQSPSPFSLSGAVLNDHLVSLIKSLNQAGASLHWDDEGVHSRGPREQGFDGKIIYAGDSPLTLYLLLALALAEPGRCKFTGGTQLKLANLAPLIQLFPSLGTRLSQVIPGSRGIPARIEVSAVLPEEVRLPRDLPPLFACALALAAPSYPNGMTLSWEEDAPFADALAPVADLLTAWSLNAELSPTALSVSPGAPEPPENYRLPMDPRIGSWLLALPLVTGQKGKEQDAKAVIDGVWPRDLAPWSYLKNLLRAASLDVTPGADSAVSRFGTKADKGSLLLDSTAFPEYFPFTASLAAVLAMNGKRVRITPPSDTERGFAMELYERLGLTLTQEGESFTVVKSGQAPDTRKLTPWLSPGPAWTLAMALAAFRRPGMALANPGGVTELMPGFWTLYNALPEPPKGLGQSMGQARGSKKETSDDKPKPKGRRIRL